MTLLAGGFTGIFSFGATLRSDARGAPRRLACRRRLEQFHHVAGGILAEDLPPARAVDDVVAERHPLRAQRVTKPARSVTCSTNRFQPPGSGFLPSGIGFAAEARGPASHSVRSSRATIAIAGPNCCRSVKPRCV